MGTTLNQSTQKFRAIGIVNEISITQEPCEVKIRDKDGNDNGTMDAERIYGKINLKLDKGTQTFDFFYNSVTSRGESSKSWKNALALHKLNPATGGNKEIDPSMVVITGRVTENKYNGKTRLVWNASSISTSNIDADDEPGCTLTGNFFINKIAPEIVNEEETGRLNVELFAVGYKADPIQIECVVEEDLADAFEDIYSVGDTATFTLDTCFKHVGGEKKQTKMAFGKGGKVNTNLSYDRQYLALVGGLDPIEEPDEEEDEDGNIVTRDNGYIDPKTMKIALKERDTAIKETEEQETTTKKTTTADRKKAQKNKGIGKASPIPDDDEDDPF